MNKKIIFLFLVLISFKTFSQKKISGIVNSSENNLPLNNVSVYDTNGYLLTKTNAKGRFNTVLNNSNESLTFYIDGFKILKKAIPVTQDFFLKIEMIPFSEQLSEVEIQTQRKKVFALKQLSSTQGTAIYAGKKSEVILLDQVVANTATNNARQIYAQVVGLNIYENDDAGLQLNIGGRGLDPNRTSNFNTRQNGYDMSADVLGYPESYYSPPSDALEEIQVVRGAASLQYGTQFGGLLNFKFKKPSKTSFEFITRQSLGSYGVFNSFNSVSGTSNKTSYYGYVNYKQGNGFRPNSNFKSFNLFAQLKHQFNAKTSLSFEVTYLDYLTKQAGGLTDTQFKKDIFFSNRSRNWFAVNWNLWAVKFQHNFSETTKFTFNLFGLQSSRYALGFRIKDSFTGKNLGNFVPLNEPDVIEDNKYIYFRDLIKGKYKNWGIETRFLSNYKLGNQSQTYLFGLKYYQANNSEQQGLGSRSVDADFNYVVSEKELKSNFKFPNQNLALFAEHIFKVNNKLSITPGIRFEHIKTESKGIYKNILRDGAGDPLPGGTFYINDNRIKERNFALLGIGFSYKMNPFVEFYANGSQNYRSVTFNDIRTVNPTFIVDENIGDEKGGTADLGVRGKYKNYVSYDIGGFTLFYNDRIGEVIENQGKNKGDRVRTNIGNALIYGFEGLIAFNLAEGLKFNNSKYVFNNFINLAITSSKYTSSIKPGVVGKKVEFIPFVNLKTGIKFGYKNWLSSIQFTYLSKQFTDATNAKAELPGELREGFVGEIPMYSIADFSLSYSYKKWKFETGVNNLFDRHYFTRRATGYPGPGIIPSLPINWYGTIQLKL